MGKFRDKKIQGATYSMSHLDDATIVVPGLVKPFKLLISYSCHCFTEELKAHHTPDTHYRHGHEVRAFCTIRHGLSVALPGLIAGLLGKSVYSAQRGNYFIIRSNGGAYVVFFNVRRATNPKYDVILTVQSAHLRPNFIQYAKPVTFDALVEASATGAAPQLGKKQKIKRI